MCDGREEKTVEMNKSVNDLNDSIAHKIWHQLKDKKILCINLMGAPGSGKTTVIERLSKELKNIAVIQGDLESDVDKKRLEKIGIPAYQINTHSGCHLNADMIHNALMNMDLSGKKYLIIENVGNLVCPAGVRIGQYLDIVVSSTTEGSDKPKKYPIIFMNAKLVLISKYDLAKIVDFNEEEYMNDIKNINGKANIIKVSINGSFKELANFLAHQREHIISSGNHQ